VGTVPLHCELLAVEGIRLYESALVRVRKEVGGLGAPENFLPISEHRKGNLIASVEQNVQGGFQLGGQQWSAYLLSNSRVLKNL